MTAKESQNGGDGAERFPIRFPVEVLLTGELEPGAFETWGVSKAGISLRSQQVIKVDQGIYVKMTLPLGIGTRCLKGAVVYCSVGDGPFVGEGGVGVQWAGGQDEALARWHEFVEVVSEVLRDGSAALTVGFESAEGRGAVLSSEAVELRKFERYAARLLVSFDSIDEFGDCVQAGGAEAEAGDVSAGGMFLVTAAPLMVGELVEVRARHPETDISFALRAAIRWRGQKGSQFGVGVEFLKQEESEVKAFQSFLENHMVIKEPLE